MIAKHPALVELIARVCHEANRAYCGSMGDESQVPWEIAPTWQRESLIKSVNFYLQRPRQPHEMHENWMKDKLADGWVYGEVKDPEKKTHPCLLSHEELPQTQRSKDYIFGAICDTLSEVLSEFVVSEEECQSGTAQGQNPQMHLLEFEKAQFEFQKHKALLDYYATLDFSDADFVKQVQDKIKNYFL